MNITGRLLLSSFFNQCDFNSFFMSSQFGLVSSSSFKRDWKYVAEMRIGGQERTTLPVTSSFKKVEESIAGVQTPQLVREI